MRLKTGHTVDLRNYSPRAFNRGASRVTEALWLVVRSIFFLLPIPLPSAIRSGFLRLFGATVGDGVVIRSRVFVQFPWRLEIGDHVWIGEESILLNLAQITIGSHVCISQRAFLCTGSHDYKSPSFDLIAEPIVVENGAWLGASSFVAPGVTARSHSVLTAGSVATRELAAFGIYQGNPAAFVRRRAINEMSPEHAVGERPALREMSVNR